MTEEDGTAGAALAALRVEVAAGLSRPQKEIAPRFFYDRRGSELFEAITTLPEYYPTRAERTLLEAHAGRWLAGLQPQAVVELGAGAADKTRILLDGLRPVTPRAAYVPIDISARFLDDVAAGLRQEYPDLDIRPVVGDIAVALPLPPDLPRPALFAFLGGTIGNFGPADAVALLRRVRHALRARDALLLGLDLHKPAEVLEAAYNDARGVTAEFNLNALRVLNREVGTDFDPSRFRHRAFYNVAERRIEMHLVATVAQRIRIPGAGTISFEAGESLRTEISCKYDRPQAERMLGAAGLALAEWTVAPPGFALALVRPA